jgi:hypothetical protein
MHILARKLNWSRGSSVGRVNRIWAGQSKNTSSIPDREAGFSFLQVLQTETWLHPTCSSSETWTSFLGVENTEV